MNLAIPQALRFDAAGVCPREIAAESKARADFRERSPRWRGPRAPQIWGWALGGCTTLVMAFLYIPTLLLIAYSFNDSRIGNAWHGFTLKWYVQLAQNQPLIDSLKNSLLIAGTTTVLSVILGTLGGWVLNTYKFRWTRSIGFLVFIPMVIPEVLMGVGLLTTFVFAKLPLGYFTNIIAHTTLCFPFVLIAIQARLNGMDPALEEAAMNLGARPLQTFRLVTIPYLMPAVISGALMTFTISMDEYLITAFTSSAQSQTLPLKVYGLAKVGLNPELNALTTIFILVTIMSVILSDFLLKRRGT